MVDLFETFLALDAATPAERQAVRDALAADPALATDLFAVAKAERVAAARWDDLLPDRSVLVLLALDQSGYPLDDDEQARLDAARPALARLLDAVPAAHTVLGRISAEAQDFEQCWKESIEPPVESMFASRADRAAAPRGRSIRRTAWRVSLVFTLALIAVVGTLLVRRDAAQIVRTATAAEVVRLADGTTVRLRPGATLTYTDPEKATRRAVSLTGNAVFDVATTGTPFTVETPSGRVTVTGTVFGVRASDAQTEVTLVEGRVLLASKDAATGVTLAPGQQSRVMLGALPTTPTEVELAETMAWSGRFYFRDTPLRTAADRLATHFQTRITVSDALARERVNGEFEETQPLAEILSTLAASLPNAKVERTATGFALR